MTQDAKLDFYLKNRKQIEEWAALRTNAQTALDQALLVALAQIADGDVPAPEVPTTRGVRNVKLRLPGEETAPAWVELNWTAANLLKDSGGGEWPRLIVAVTPDASYLETRRRIKQAVLARAVQLGLLEEERTGWWLRSALLIPAAEPIEIEAYAAHCVAQFTGAWRSLQADMVAAIQAKDPA